VAASTEWCKRRHGLVGKLLGPAAAGPRAHAQMSPAVANNHLQTLERLSGVAAGFAFATHGASVKEVIEANWGRIRRMYKVASLRHHPDKGGRREDFQAASTAYDALKAAKEGEAVAAEGGGRELT
jgi:hypothetical protein